MCKPSRITLLGEVTSHNTLAS